MSIDKTTYTFKDKLVSVGPGILIVGSFIGPGTLTSATRAGASFGYDLLWTIAFSVIAVLVTQEMSSRLGIVTQKGLAEAILDAFAHNKTLKLFMMWLVGSAITLGSIAYIGGDLTGTAAGLSQLTGIPTNYLAPMWGFCMIFLINTGNAVKNLEKLLAVCVSVMAFVFIVTMITVKPDLGAVLAGFVPKVPEGALLNCVALIGTTVVPYNMFIHAISAKKTWKSPSQLPLAKFDVTVSMLIGGTITCAVVITAATVMNGMSVKSVADMAVQLEPLLGEFSKPFLSIGMIAAGVSSALLSPLGASYVLAGLLGWDIENDDKRFKITNIVIIVFGIIISGTGYNPVSIILVAQAINGVFLPIIVGTVVYLTSRKSIMGEYTNSVISNVLGIAIFAISLIIGVSSVVSLF